MATSITTNLHTDQVLPDLPRYIAHHMTAICQRHWPLYRSGELPSHAWQAGLEDSRQPRPAGASISEAVEPDNQCTIRRCCGHVLRLLSLEQCSTTCPDALLCSAAATPSCDNAKRPCFRSWRCGGCCSAVCARRQRSIPGEPSSQSPSSSCLRVCVHVHSGRQKRKSSLGCCIATMHAARHGGGYVAKRMA
jgi:hypothetical protein